MPLSEPRSGKSFGLHAYPATSNEGTLGDIETIIWSSIRHLCSRGVAEAIAHNIHGIKRTGILKDVSYNLKLYINQAYEFYQAAKIAKPNTAPLIYYYSFLNLAKAFCEIRNPNFHRKKENYHHGISRRSDREYVVNIHREVINLTKRGVWQTLWEEITHTTCVIPRGASFRIKDLFLYCPEISIEAPRSLGKDSQIISLIKPDILYDESAKHAWIRFNVERSELKDFSLTAPRFLAALTTPRSGYIEVRSTESNLRAFESAVPAKVTKRNSILESLYNDVIGMNLFCTYYEPGKLSYYIPVQHKLNLRMPQIMVLYTILFWLGSLVRYDPHSIDDLMDSPGWILIDGFMSQSRIFLLEQFEWALYQTETTLWNAR